MKRDGITPGFPETATALAVASVQAAMTLAGGASSERNRNAGCVPRPAL